MGIKEIGLQILPSTAIILANLLYFYYFSQNDQLKWYEVFLFNFFIMSFLGIFIVLKLNLLLHQWFVVEKQKDDKGNLTKKGIVKQKIAQLLNKSYLLDSLFLPGNQKVFLKVYFGLTALRYLTSFIPGLLFTLLTFLFFQFKGKIYPIVSPILSKLNSLFDQLCEKVLNTVPKYKHIKQRLVVNQEKKQ